VRLFLSGLRKLARRLATLLTFGLLAGLLVLIIIAVVASGGEGGDEQFDPLTLVTFPAAYDLILGFMLALGGMFGVVYGAAIAGSEWSWGTLKAVVARGESRSRYMLATFAAVAVVIAVGLVVTFVIGVGTAAAGATISAISTEGIGDTDALGRLPERAPVRLAALDAVDVHQPGVALAITRVHRDIPLVPFMPSMPFPSLHGVDLPSRHGASALSMLRMVPTGRSSPRWTGTTV
jgi:hypothetical protein